MAARAQVGALEDRLVTGFGDDDLVEGLAAVQTLKGAGGVRSGASLSSFLCK